MVLKTNKGKLIQEHAASSSQVLNLVKVYELKKKKKHKFLLSFIFEEQKCRIHTMINKSSRSQPKLSTVLTRRVHDTEVILSMAQQHLLFMSRQLSNATHKVFNFIVPFP